MAIKKSEIYSSLDASCDKLRGGMDPSQYKNYILSLLFMKYVTVKFKGKPYPQVTVPEGGSFDDLKALGTIAAAKEKGKVRSEGKDYVMKDGDIVNFLFNV